MIEAREEDEIKVLPKQTLFGSNTIGYGPGSIIWVDVHLPANLEFENGKIKIWSLEIWFLNVNGYQQNIHLKREDGHSNRWVRANDVPQDASNSGAKIPMDVNTAYLYETLSNSEFEFLDNFSRMVAKSAAFHRVLLFERLKRDQFRSPF